jgi:hypothetical protein
MLCGLQAKKRTTRDDAKQHLTAEPQGAGGSATSGAEERAQKQQRHMAGHTAPQALAAAQQQRGTAALAQAPGTRQATRSRAGR